MSAHPRLPAGWLEFVDPTWSGKPRILLLSGIWILMRLPTARMNTYAFNLTPDVGDK